MMIECSMCETGLANSGKHVCYGVQDGEVHTIDSKPVCHGCWDKDLLGCVEQAEKQLGIL